MKKLSFVLLVMILLSSCSVNKTLYVNGNSWKPLPKKSQATGWYYIKKK